ncbi:hypothetical protein D0864_06116 [Hortaea werneckii]|uniref:Velvet domain-containing protein n=1 Tax=Hortaea werneckii TaxID=91943 RepID=A0A3M7FR58_HORWE|nr:hypothetical protein KC323_g4573 [Hortaea werneckii]KAI6871910.1 hypothetical protein KC338_g2369 [Hortaea werneckii]KAI7357357.1 hypothetical protein KC320_g1804 [Hortaea werneckii]RMY91176.1 hypothetical protein D0864_06116 [Hortaea werneckii]RMZ07968.1 hypothetical protein D0862_04101 [Hortaea werneckii]
MSMPFIGPPQRQGEPPVLTNNNVGLTIRQQPRQGLVTLPHKEKSRKPIDPPPIVQITVQSMTLDKDESWLVSPFLFMMVTLLEGSTGDTPVQGAPIVGQSSSSLHRLKDITNKDGGFFVFGDISIKVLGIHRLRFNLFNADHKDGGVTYITHIDSEPFHVVNNKEFAGLTESSHLSRTFSDQGVRLRLRKEPRQLGQSSASKRNFNAIEESSPAEARPVYSGPSSQYVYATPSIKRQRSENEFGSPPYMRSHGSSIPQYGASNISPVDRSWYDQGQGAQQIMPAYGMPVSDPSSGYEFHGSSQGGMNPLSAAGIASFPRSFPPAQIPSTTGYSHEMAMGRMGTMETTGGQMNADYEAPGTAQYGSRANASGSLHTPSHSTGSTGQHGVLPANAGSEGHTSELGYMGMASEPNYGVRPVSARSGYSALPPTAMPVQSNQPYYPPHLQQSPMYSDSDRVSHSGLQQAYPSHPSVPSPAHSELNNTMLNSSFAGQASSTGSVTPHAGGMHLMSSSGLAEPSEMPQQQPLYASLQHHKSYG